MAESGGAAARLYVSVGADVSKAVAGLRAVDAQLKQTTRSARGMDTTLRRGSATSKGAAATYTMVGSSAAAAGRQTAVAAKATKEVTSSAQAARGALGGMGLGMTAAQGGAVALAYGLGKSVKLAADFDSGMRNVNSIAQLSENNFQRLKSSVLNLAGPTAQAPETLASGMYDLVSSGFKASDAVTVLKASAIAATAGLTDAETATKAVAGAINAYQLKASDAQMVSDLLFTTVDKGVLTFSDLANGLGPVLPFATKLGVDLKQVGAMLASLTINGVPAAEAMTYTKGAMAQLVKPTTELKRELKDLGVASGAELIASTGSIQAAMEALYNSVGRNDQKFAKLFPDIRGLSAAFTVTGKGAEDAKQMLREFNVEAGRTQQVFKEQSKGTGFTWKQLSADIKQAGVNVGQHFSPAVRTGGDALHRFFQVTNNNKSTLSSALKSVQNFALGSVLGPAGKIASQVNDINKLTGAFDGLKNAIPTKGKGADYSGLQKGLTIKVDNNDAKKRIIDTTKGLGAIPGLITTRIKVETDADIVAERTRIQLTKAAKPILIKTQIDRAGNANTVVSPYKIKPVKVPIEKPKPFKLTLDNSSVRRGAAQTKGLLDVLPKYKKTKVDADPSGAKRGAAEAKRAIDSVTGKTVFIDVKQRGSKGRAMGGRVGIGEATTLVGERGPELVSLPNGSMVHTAAATRRMLANEGVPAYAGGTKSSKKKLSRSERISRNNDRIDRRSRVLDLRAERVQVNQGDVERAGKSIDIAERHLREAKKMRGRDRTEAIARAQLEIAQARKEKADAEKALREKEREAESRALEEHTAALQEHTKALAENKKEMEERNRLTAATHNINTEQLNRAFVDWISNQLGGRIGESTRTLSPKAVY